MKLLLYCVKAKPILRDYRGKAIFNRFVISPTDRPFTSDDTQPILNGKIVGECDFEVEEFDFASQRFFENDIEKYNIEIKKQNELLHKSCLTATQMVCYLDKKGKGQTNLNGYAIHIKNLHIFDKPKELSEYMVYDKSYDNMFGWAFEEKEKYKPLTKAPQNMMYAFDNKGNKYIVISIQPQWLCKILNGEKTIEVRKKVLKEMIK